MHQVDCCRIHMISRWRRGKPVVLIDCTGQLPCGYDSVCLIQYGGGFNTKQINDARACAQANYSSYASLLSALTQFEHFYRRLPVVADVAVMLTFINRSHQNRHTKTEKGSGRIHHNVNLTNC